MNSGRVHLLVVLRFDDVQYVHIIPFDLSALFLLIHQPLIGWLVGCFCTFECQHKYIHGPLNSVNK